MSAALEPASTEVVSLEQGQSNQPRRSRPRLAALGAVGRVLVGMALCAHPATALLVVGWTVRLMRRRTLVGWWKQSPRRDELPFEAFATSLGLDVPAGPAPRWLRAEPNAPAAPGLWARLARSGLARNLATGFAVLGAGVYLRGDPPAFPALDRGVAVRVGQFVQQDL